MSAVHNILTTLQGGPLPSGAAEEASSVLEVERVGLEDGGTYVCTAETDTNTVHKTVQVTNSGELRYKDPKQVDKVLGSLVLRFLGLEILKTAHRL